MVPVLDVGMSKAKLRKRQAALAVRLVRSASIMANEAYRRLNAQSRTIMTEALFCLIAENNRLITKLQEQEGMA